MLIGFVTSYVETAF